MAAIFDNLVECLIEREGPTIFHIGKVQYVFAPRPELTGDNEASVCVVISKEHRDYLLNDTMCSGYYRKYVPKVHIENAKEVAERAAFEEFRRLRNAGFSMEDILAMVGDNEQPSAGIEQGKQADKSGGLTKDAFFALTNVAQVKAAIKKCGDRDLLDELGSIEDASPTKRVWVIEALDARLLELAPPPEQDKTKEI